MAILPNDGDSIGSGWNNGGNAGFFGIGEDEIEDLRAWGGRHVFVPATAKGAGTSRSQKREWIDAFMPIVPFHYHL